MEPVIQALSDCERVRPGLLGQPMNTASSIAFIATGLWLARKAPQQGDTRDLRHYGAALAIVGVGSVAYHGPGGALAKWIHDVGVTVPLLVLGVVIVARRRGLNTATSARLILAALTTIAVLLRARPAWSVPIAGTVVVAVAAAELDAWWRHRLRPAPRLTAAAVGVAALLGGAAIDALSRTGAPWCRPESLFQGHAAWHVLAAGGLALYGWAALGEWADLGL